MQTITPGHKYIAQNFGDANQGQTIQFIEKVPRREHPSMSQAYTDPGELVTRNDGTTNEELIKILIDRLSYLQEKFPCKENACCITHLQEGLHWLEARTADRLKRQVEGKALA
jgi:hypothetical protein